MDKIEKLFRKISKKDRQNLLYIINLLLSGQITKLQVSKIKTTDFFRLRSGKYRIIFHKEQGEIIVDSIKLRNEKTYKGL